MKRIGFWIVLSALLLTACSKRVYVPVEHAVTEYRDKIVQDSVYVHDSVMIYAKNDTVFNTRFIDRFKFRYVHDTVSVERTDSIPYPVKEVVTVKRTAWGVTCWIAALVCALTVITCKGWWKRIAEAVLKLLLRVKT